MIKVAVNRKGASKLAPPGVNFGAVYEIIRFRLPMSSMQALRSIVYASEATIPISTSDLEALLISARNSNQRNGITGVLLYSGKQFLQCFEGPDDAVQETYDRIYRDRLHRDLMVYMDSAVPVRSFDEWAMGCAMPTTSELLTLATAGWNATNAAMAFTPSSPPGLGVLKFFWNTRQSEL